MREDFVLLAVLILVMTAFTGCSKPADTEKETTTPSPAGTTEAPPKARREHRAIFVTDSLPELDFGDRLSRFSIGKRRSAPSSESISGDIIGDAVYTRTPRHRTALELSWSSTTSPAITRTWKTIFKRQRPIFVGGGTVRYFCKLQHVRSHAGDKRIYARPALTGIPRL